MSRHAQVRIKFDTTSATLRYSELIRKCIHTDPRRPDKCMGPDLFSRLQSNERRPDLGDCFTKAHLDATLFQFPFGICSQFFLECCQHFFSHLNQDYSRTVRGELMVIIWQQVIKKIAKGTCSFNSGWASTHDYKIQHTILYEFGVAVGQFKFLQNLIT